MVQPKVHLKSEPFPHAIIEDFYDEIELESIWKEINFLSEDHKFKLATDSGSSKDIDSVSGLPKAKHKAIYLDVLYSDRNFSNIMLASDKVLNPDLLKVIADLHPLMGHLNHVNNSYTKIKYYGNDDYYGSHWDESRFTCVSYVHKEPKAFTGGNLCFNEFDYSIEVKNNMAVIFCGSILHSSTPVKLESDVPYTGKYSITKFLNLVQ